jgi:hypothetical protein
VKSEWVKAEAEDAAPRGKLLPVLLEHVRLPRKFARYQTMNLTEWQGDPQSPEFVELLREIGDRTGRPVKLPRPERPIVVKHPSLPPEILGPGSPEKSSLHERDRTKVAAGTPKVVTDQWQIIRAYLYRESEEHEVLADAEELRPETPGERGLRVSQGANVPKGTRITVTIQLPSAECKPASHEFTHSGSWNKTDFEVRAVDVTASAADGVVSWFAGLVCIGEVRFTVEYSCKRTDEPVRLPLARAPGYESVFVSYSTKDAMIVDWLESSYRALGMEYLRDVKTLRSGETWDERLLELIRGADLFQLCWSQNAKASPYVNDEWRFALGLNKSHFVRPCYWEDPMPEPPEELKRLHFAKLKPHWWMRLWMRVQQLFE